MSAAFNPNNKIILKEQNTQKNQNPACHRHTTNYVIGSHPTIKAITREVKKHLPSIKSIMLVLGKIEMCSSIN
jgi:hypothetical protein